MEKVCTVTQIRLGEGGGGDATGGGGGSANREPGSFVRRPFKPQGGSVSELAILQHKPHWLNLLVELVEVLLLGLPQLLGIDDLKIQGRRCEVDDLGQALLIHLGGLLALEEQSRKSAAWSQDRQILMVADQLSPGEILWAVRDDVLDWQISQHAAVVQVRRNLGNKEDHRFLPGPSLVAFTAAGTGPKPKASRILQQEPAACLEGNAATS